MKKIYSMLCILFFLMSPSVFAIDLSTAKAQGKVGEKMDGYLGIVQSSSEIKALVADINAKRKSKYQQLSKQQSVPLKKIEAIAGEKAISKTKPGHYIQLPNGKWKKK